MADVQGLRLDNDIRATKNACHCSRQRRSLGKAPCAKSRTGYLGSMSSVEIIDQIRAMPSAERREIIEKIWDEFADRELELTPKQAAELDRRLAEHRADPNDVVSWNRVKAATEAKYRGKG